MAAMIRASSASQLSSSTRPAPSSDARRRSVVSRRSAYRRRLHSVVSIPIGRISARFGSTRIYPASSLHTTLCLGIGCVRRQLEALVAHVTNASRARPSFNRRGHPRGQGDRAQRSGSTPAVQPRAHCPARGTRTGRRPRRHRLRRRRVAWRSPSSSLIVLIYLIRQLETCDHVVGCSEGPVHRLDVLAQVLPEGFQLSDSGLCLLEVERRDP